MSLISNKNMGLCLYMKGTESDCMILNQHINQPLLSAKRNLRKCNKLGETFSVCDQICERHKVKYNSFENLNTQVYNLEIPTINT